VTVSVEAIQSYRVFVTGEVRLPGVFASEKPINVLQALTLAGAFLDWAKPNDTVIIRGSGTDGVIFDFEYDRVIRGERLDQNILLQSGDVVVVPR
jgi:polysaccharide export outer membrane protein